MGLIDRILGRKPFDPDARHRLLLSTGRITDGVILDSHVNGEGDEMVSFTYTLNGVDFESSELLTAERRHEPARYPPGAKVGIRYDQRNQGNSIVE